MSAISSGAGITPAPSRIEVEIESGRTHRWPIRSTDVSSGVGVAISASTQVLAGDVCELLGYSLVETSGAAVMSFRLHDGSGTADTLLAVGGAAASTSTSLILPEHGIEVLTGKVFIEVTSGHLAGVIYWR